MRIRPLELGLGRGLALGLGLRVKTRVVRVASTPRSDPARSTSVILPTFRNRVRTRVIVRIRVRVTVILPTFRMKVTMRITVMGSRVKGKG